MALNGWALFNGISETALVLLGVFYFFKFFIDYGKSKKKLTPLLAILALSLGSMHLGGSVAFIMKLFWELDLNYVVFGYLTYIPMPVGFTLAIYIAYEVFNPKLKWLMVAIHAALGIALIVALVGWPDIQMQELPATSETLVDANIQSVVGTIFTIYIVSALLALGFNFFQIRGKMNESEALMRKKSLLLGLGWILWGIAEFFAKGQFDFIPIELVIVPNSIIFTSLIMIFLGFAPSKEV
ncbi:MAG: hypothetical protein ACTSRE_10200 [Promethearchaeota archaeon]